MPKYIISQGFYKNIDSADTCFSSTKVEFFWKKKIISYFLNYSNYIKNGLFFKSNNLNKIIFYLLTKSTKKIYLLKIKHTVTFHL